eukprot:7658487-Ditylum_brightwellii.AAC.1
MDAFCLAMDNYFTLLKVIAKLHKIGVGIVGTVRARRGWPPKELSNAIQQDANFNNLFWTVDVFGILVVQWMDNGFVLCVTTLHKVGEIVERLRKCPRTAVKNKLHAAKVWGDKGKKHIFISTLIDDYNHWMCGVDIVDQHIAYYHPDLRCRRNWIPIFIQILSIMQNNAYVLYKDHHGKNTSSHKHFTMEWVKLFINKTKMHFCEDLDSESTFAPNTKSSAPSSLPLTVAVSPRKWDIMKYLDDLLCSFPIRKGQPRELHQCIWKQQKFKGVCVVCSALYKQKKKSSDDVDYKSL